MRQKLSLTGGIFPMPVLMIATYNEDGSVDVMNAAWGTMLDMSVVALNLSESHRTMENIRRSGAFTVSVADAAHVTEADYFGVVSAKNDPRKFEKSGLTAVRAETVDAPVICEFPLCLECQYLGYEGGEHGIGAGLNRGSEMLHRTGTARGDDRNGDRLAHGSQHRQVEAGFGAIGIHRVEQDLPHSKLLATL